MEFTHTLNVLEDFSIEFEKLYKDKLKRDGHVATGDLINTMHGEVKVDDDIFTFQLSLQEYWKWIESGTKPHFPPIEAIKKWIIAKPVIPREMHGIKPTTDQLAFLIARKISRDGTRAGLEYSETVNELNAVLEKKISDALQKDIEEYIEEIILTIK